MAKLVALLATLLVAAHVAAAYHTTITTVETIDSENPSRQECQRELQGKDLNACMRYLMEKQGGGRYEIGTRGGSGEYERCCNQLKSIHNEECMCEGLKMEIEQQRMSRPEMMGPMMRMAENLPQMCGAMSSPCNFRSRMY